MFVEIEGERQCTRCQQCKPVSAFSPANSRCKACRAEVARLRKMEHPSRRRLREARPWSDEEVDVLFEHYPSGGVPACAPLLDRTQCQIKNKVEKLGLCREAQARVYEEPEWAIPTHDYGPEDYALRKMPALSDWAPVGVLSPSVGLVLGEAA